MPQEKAVGFFSGIPERAEQEIVLPSGRKITVLETTGKQESLFSTIANGSNVALVVNKFLSQCTKNLDGVEGHPDHDKFDDMLQGDRTAILLYVRVLSHGPLVEYALTCSNPKCAQKSEHEVDLQPVLASIKPYPHGDQREHKATIDGGVLHFELPTGATEKKLSQDKDPDLNKRITSLRMWEETPKGKLPVSIENMRSKHISLLRKAVRDLECKIDTTAQLRCTHCGTLHSVGIVEHPDFLFPNLM